MYSKRDMKKTKYVTTAIVYPNSRIHVGWAWECLGADWLTRCYKAMGETTFFATGMDEHSINVQRAAEAQNLSPQKYCDNMAVDIEKTLTRAGIAYDRFIRTSDKDHERVVQKLVQKVFEQGDIYEAQYEGLYCESCEAYYTEKDLVNGLCPAHQKPVKSISERNYFFKLSKYQAALEKLFADHPDFLAPDYRRAEVLNFIQAGLKDFSISRSTFTWGIPLPFDPKHVVYVWFDALINYLTAAGLEYELNDPKSPEAAVFRSRWPADVHVIGKDISRFHCVFWPAMLMAMDLPIPRQVFAHGYITHKGNRMSKSTGNVVEPNAIMDISGADPFRYYLLAENQFSQDGNFAMDLLVLKNNADLSNDFGNLINRSINMVRKYFPETAIKARPVTDITREVVASFANLKAELNTAIAAIDSQAYAVAIFKRSRELNLLIDRVKPWGLAKQMGVAQTAGDTALYQKLEGELLETLYTLMEGVRWMATALKPLVPFRMPEAFRQLGVLEPSDFGGLAGLAWGETEFTPVEPSPIYPRIELPVDPDSQA